jgi:hypothetical protein
LEEGGGGRGKEKYFSLYYIILYYIVRKGKKDRESKDTKVEFLTPKEQFTKELH